ncbi:unnamed protein product [Camellia sinensis]
MRCGFQKSSSEPTLYVKGDGMSNILIVALYVDDLIFVGNNEKMLQQLKRDMMHIYKMNHMGLMQYFLGIEVEQGSGSIFISQGKHVEILLKKFNMLGCKSVNTPLVVNEKLQKEDGTQKVDGKIYRSLVGSLLYLITTRPDIMFAASLVSRFMENPTQCQRILRYLQGTIDFGIWYSSLEDSKLIGFSDSDWAGSIDDMKSTSGYVFS